MRVVLLALALLAALKVWAQDSLYRSATEQALLAAYRERAVAACQTATQHAAQASPLALAIDWSSERRATITIGNSAVAVYPWQLDNERWADRYRKAYLMLSAPEANLVCAFDLNSGKADVAPL